MLKGIVRLQKPDAKNVMEVVERRGVPYFLHYTPVRNLESILKHGILSRKQMGIREIKPVLYHGWGKKWKELDEYICLSLIPPRGMIDKTKELQVVLAIRSEVAGYKNTCFSPINSAKDNIEIGEIFARDSAETFEDLFRNEEGLQLRNDFAEVLVKDYIGVEDIQTIYFSGGKGWSSGYYSTWWRSLLGKCPPVKINRSLF